MRCDQARRMSERKAARGLSPRDEEILAEHLSACTECTALESQLDRTWQALEHHPSIEVSEKFLPQLRAKLRAENPEPRRGWVWRPAWGWRWAAVAVGIALAVVILARSGQLRHETGSKPPHATIISDRDRRDDQFLEDLERTLQYSAADTLSAFDSWPYAPQDSPAYEPTKILPAKNPKQKEPS